MENAIPMDYKFHILQNNIKKIAHHDSAKQFEIPDFKGICNSFLLYFSLAGAKFHWLLNANIFAFVNGLSKIERQLSMMVIILKRPLLVLWY
jgi:hypothetical protein